MVVVEHLIVEHVRVQNNAMPLENVMILQPVLLLQILAEQEFVEQLKMELADK